MSEKNISRYCPFKQRYQCSHRAYQPAAPDPGCTHSRLSPPFPFNDFDPSFHHACQHWHLTHWWIFSRPSAPHINSPSFHSQFNLFLFTCSTVIVLYFLSLPVFLFWYLTNFLCLYFFLCSSSPSLFSFSYTPLSSFLSPFIPLCHFLLSSYISWLFSLSSLSLTTFLLNLQTYILIMLLPFSSLLLYRYLLTFLLATSYISSLHSKSMPLQTPNVSPYKPSWTFPPFLQQHLTYLHTFLLAPSSSSQK